MRSNQHGIGGSGTDTYCTQTQLAGSFRPTSPTVKLMSVCTDTLMMEGKQLKQYFVAGLQPKGINSEFLPAAAS